MCLPPQCCCSSSPPPSLASGRTPTARRRRVGLGLRGRLGARLPAPLGGLGRLIDRQLLILGGAVVHRRCVRGDGVLIRGRLGLGRMGGGRRRLRGRKIGGRLPGGGEKGKKMKNRLRKETTQQLKTVDMVDVILKRPTIPLQSLLMAGT